MITRIIILTLLAIITTGCATVNRGATDYFRIDTVPQGAKATTTIETRDSIRARQKIQRHLRNIMPANRRLAPSHCLGAQNLSLS